MESNVKNITASPTSLSNYFVFTQLLQRNEVSMVYGGEFSQDLIKTLLAFTERKFNDEHLEDNIRRKIFNIMVEMLQNISKNALDNEQELCEYSPVFMMGETEDYHFLVSSNKIANESIPNLKARIDQVNELDSEGLKKLYKEVRIGGTFSNVGGAGIGVIDMARKSENKLDYEFTSIDDKHSMFALLIKVNK